MPRKRAINLSQFAKNVRTWIAESKSGNYKEGWNRLTPAQQRQFLKRRYMDFYNLSPQGRQATRYYEQTAKAIAARRKRVKRYSQTEKGKQAHREAQRRYKASLRK